MNDVAEAMRQMFEGADFTDPEKLVRRISAETACRKPEGFPYSLATNVYHCDIWNRVWLARVKGLPKVNPFPDFLVVEPGEWPQVRDSFVDGVREAYQIASAEPFVHSHRTDEAAKKLLLKIAVHTAYHLGQINLLKRMLRLTDA